MAKPDLAQGVFCPVVMPFRGDLSPDSRRLLEHCQWVLGQGVGLAVFGTNSEGNSLAVSEKIALLDALADGGIDPGRMMPGTGCCALTETVQLTAHAIGMGCAGALMLPPFYYKGVSDDGLFASYAEVIERVGSSDLRIYLYHIPPVAQVGLSLDLIERLISAYPETIVGIKDSSGDWDNTLAMHHRQWPKFQIFVGSETLLLQNMRTGGAGCISATTNINPGAIHQLYAQWQNNDADSAQQRLSQVRHALEGLPMIAAMKAIIGAARSDPVWNRVRPPLEELDSRRRVRLLNTLAEAEFDLAALRCSSNRTAPANQ